MISGWWLGKFEISYSRNLDNFLNYLLINAFLSFILLLLKENLCFRHSARFLK